MPLSYSGRRRGGECLGESRVVLSWEEVLVLVSGEKALRVVLAVGFEDCNGFASLHVRTSCGVGWKSRVASVCVEYDETRSRDYKA